MMDQVFQFVDTFKAFPPRSFPPSFNPANIMEQTLDDIKTRKMLKESIDPNRIPRRAQQNDRTADAGAPSDAPSAAVTGTAACFRKL